MKPRLPSVPLTSEDYDIFTYGARRVLTHEHAQLAFHLDRISETHDRRDAERMHGLTHKYFRCPTCIAVTGFTADDLATVFESMNAWRTGQIM